MTAVRDESQDVKVVPDAPRVVSAEPELVVVTTGGLRSETDASGAFSQLVDAKARHVLGIGGEEFKRRWYAGDYRTDTRPAVRALDTLMRTGEWPAPDAGS